MLYFLVFVIQTLHIWLGGLFTPEAYITATRQYVAQANNWSLEELYLDVSHVQTLCHSPHFTLNKWPCLLGLSKIVYTQSIALPNFSNQILINLETPEP